jgi:hypothetical protein
MAQAPIIISDDNDRGGPSLHDLGSDDHIALPNTPAAPIDRGDQAGALPQHSRDPQPQYIIDDEPRGGTQADTGRDARLNDEQGDGTYLDTQRRNTRADRRERQRQGKDRTLRELEELRAQNAELLARFGEIEPRLKQIDVARVQDEVRRLDQEIATQAQRAKEARRAMAEATTAGDSDAMNAAFDERDAAMEAARVLAARKATLEQGLDRATDNQDQGQDQDRRQQGANLPIMQRPSPEVTDRVEEFREKFPWYDTRRTDNMGRPIDWKTRVVLDIDLEVAQEGFRPDTDDYWLEVEDRMRERLPQELFRGAGRQQQSRNQDDPPPRQRQSEVSPQRRGPAMPGAGDRPNNSGGARRVHLTPARKEALQQAGVLASDGRTVQDAQRFERILRQYDNFDRENAV